MMINLHDGFGDLELIIVDSGYIAKCPITKDKAKVDDENSVAILSKLYLTKKNFDAIKNSTEIKDLVKQDVNLQTGEMMCLIY